MTDHNNKNDYLTINEAATMAGYSADYFRRCVCQGKPLGGLKPPQAVRLGLRRYIKRDVMERWLVEREKPLARNFAVVPNTKFKKGSMACYQSVKADLYDIDVLAVFQHG